MAVHTHTHTHTHLSLKQFLFLSCLPDRQVFSFLKPPVVSLALCLVYFSSFAQLVINNPSSTGAYIVMNGGTVTTPVYFNVNNKTAGTADITDIKLTNAEDASHVGWIISEGQYNYVKWNNIKTTAGFIIPFGYSTTAYIPLTFGRTAGTATNVAFSTWASGTNNKVSGVWTGTSDGGTVAAVTTMNNSAGTDISVSSVIDRWWDIYKSAAVTATVTFSYRGAENTTINPTTEITVQHWTGSLWNNGKGGVDATYTTGSPTANGVISGVGTITATGLTEFSPYILVIKSGGPLPIELLDFTAVCLSPSGGGATVYPPLEGAQGEVSVNWSTASETNNDYFTIERSLSPSGGGVGLPALPTGQAGGQAGGEWAAIGTVNGAGNSNTLINYSFTDNSLSPSGGGAGGGVYYRLKQTDFDGNYTYSGIIAVSCQDNLIEIIYIYPNPVSDSFDYIIYSTEDREIFVSVTDISGKVIISKKENIVIGLNYKSLDVSTLASAPYYLKIETLNGLYKDSKQILVK